MILMKASHRVQKVAEQLKAKMKQPKNDLIN
jgi:hypothetical protein